MTEYQFVALLLASIGPLLALARLLRAPESLVLFGVGLGSAFLPGLPPVRVDPQLLLNLFLPPLVYASTVRVSWLLLRFTLLPGAILGALLVLATIGAVAAAAHLVFLPGLSWTGSLLLGVVAAVFDTRLFHEAKGRPHVPRAIADTLKARELVARVVILATFGLILEGTAAERFSIGAVLNHYALDIPAGALLGALIGQVVVWARRRIDPAPVEIAVSISTPYASALAAYALGLSVVAAITMAALVISALRIDRRTGAPISSSETRVSATAFWEQVSLMVSSALFFLAGRALPDALGGLQIWPVWVVALCAVGVLAVVLILQFAFAYPATGLQPIANALDGRRGDGNPRLATAGVMAWSCTRSTIGLVIALSIPATLPGGQPFHERDLILAVAALTIIGSVLMQGLTLRHFIDRAALRDDAEEEREESEARQAIEIALAKPGREHANGFDAARQALLKLRERDRIGDEVLVRMLRETDLTSRAAEGDALPGAGPPNP
ncbi:MAG TPA: cation:proton antiporter [Beijerinckiaceae bacterium]|nr:cation:proton antiporter [Beijerinckiaceae bacterium]